jgi:hypothetical protein
VISKSIFVDLEISLDNILEDPKAFAAEVHLAAGKLLEVLDHSPSMGHARHNVRSEAAKDKVAKDVAFEFIKGTYDEMMESAEDLELHSLYHVIGYFKELARDLELTLDSRASNEMIRNSPTVLDKRLCHERYKNLRDAYEDYRRSINIFSDTPVVLAPLKPKTGNYGGTTKRSYPAYRYGGDVYHNYRVIARMVGINPDEIHSHMDLVERLNNMKTEVEIIEVQL